MPATKRLSFRLMVVAAILGLFNLPAPAESQSIVPIEKLLAPETESSKLDPQSLYDHVWSLINLYYYDPKFGKQNWSHWKRTLDPNADVTASIKEMLQSLNQPYVEFYERSLLLGPGTIGCLLEPATDDRWQIATVGKDSPAARAGLQPGDIIEVVATDLPNAMVGVEAGNFGVKEEARGQLTDVVALLRGPTNVPINLQLRRNGASTKVTVTRSDKDYEPQSLLHMFEGGIAYIKPALPLTGAKLEHFRTAISQLSQAGAKGLILDIRSNLSDIGTFDEVCGAFVGNKKTCGTVFRNTVSYEVGKSAQVTSLPLVVLINSTTSGSCEALAACLKTYKRATLVGDTTAGKGLILHTFNVDREHRLRFPSHQYTTCDGTPIEGHGVTPDVVVPVDKTNVLGGPWWHSSSDGKAPSIDSGKDSQLQRALQEIKTKLTVSP